MTAIASEGEAHVHDAPSCVRSHQAAAVRTRACGASSARSTGSRSMGAQRTAREISMRLLRAQERVAASTDRSDRRPSSSHAEEDGLVDRRKIRRSTAADSVGKEKGYLLYDEVNEMLPVGDHLVRGPRRSVQRVRQRGHRGRRFRQGVPRREGLRSRRLRGRGPELDLTPGALDKTNDPVRMYLREMGTVPLLTREGEVAIAKRIERGKLAVIKSISRTPTIAKRILVIGDQLRAGERTIRELVIFSDEEITDEVIEDRKAEVLEQIDEVRKARVNYVEARREARRRPEEGQEEVPPRARRRRCAPASRSRARIRRIEFTETMKRRLIDEVKDAVDAVVRVQREADAARAAAQPEDQGQGSEAEGRGEEEPPQEAEGHQDAGQGDDRRPRGDARAPAPHDRGHPARRGAGRAGEEGAGRSQPPPRRLDREEVHEPRPAVPRPDPGRQHRPDEGGGQVRVPPRLQVLDLRDVVDPPGDHPRDRRPGAHDPHPGPHDRDDQQADSHLARAGAGARPRADLGRDRQADGHPGRRRSARS